MNEQLKALISDARKSGLFMREFLRQVEIEFIKQTLIECQGNQCKAADCLQQHRNTLSRTIRELGLRPWMAAQGYTSSRGGNRSTTWAKEVKSVTTVHPAYRTSA